MKFQTRCRRQALGAIGLTAMMVTGAWAQGTYPNHPVRVIVPWPAGGSVDMATRVVAERLSGGLGQPVVVENRPGATGNIGAAAAAKSAPDGYTLLVATTPMIINRSLSGNATVDLSREFAPIGQLVSLNYVMVVNPAMAGSVQELVAKAKSRPGHYSYASSGPGTQLHLIGESFKRAAGVDLVHAPYKGAPPALADLVGGHVQLMFPGLPVVEPLLRAGQLKALAVVSTHRLPQLPEVPTLAEAGVAGIDSSEWYGLVAPAGTPPQVVARLSEELGKAMRNPAVRQRLTSQGFEPAGSTPQAFAALIEAEQKKWPLVVRRAGLQSE
ncbi:tripartite tricarboxylate transporter substrate binding protein [Cupriavidus sp. WKF15]|uniref:Bug family tripartite tricarboxylate transporter substrate binding protein n=1 Tax=Cupriavidus sp. WKF15 TaxID=3032282 RepID=UPI0023E2E658|nr:tripartite tricarboxylate transporter substrate binding protein [Cupriavidus sp. WKF15]WER49517.1 tripartite tricarboxylate transporter substrate binding protein [Cupriavidus sp. WKF15]